MNSESAVNEAEWYDGIVLAKLSLQINLLLRLDHSDGRENVFG